VAFGRPQNMTSGSPSKCRGAGGLSCVPFRILSTNTEREGEVGAALAGHPTWPELVSFFSPTLPVRVLCRGEQFS
jgi:hypothetical protein